MNTKYNGWTNRETWLVNLWLGDGFAEEAEYGHEVTAEYIEERVYEQIDEQIESSSFVRDLINTSDINYRELAAHYVCEEPTT